MTPARVLIADDHELAREGLRALLDREPGLVVVAEASTGEQAVALAEAHEPDLALLDIRYGAGMDGLEAARRIVEVAPNVRVVMLTLHDAPEYARAALEAGAMGYVTKDASRDALLRAIGQVLAGGYAVPAELMRRAVESRRTAGAPDALGRLTPREREVLDLLAEGGTNKHIAQALGVSPGTVKAHVERVIAKLGVRDRTQAAVLAVQARR
ncbi:response regulator [Sphingomonas lenta]|uniref:DNA-binding response regulator n=1 Tax=Sphingomonas lenta TaxID=1141887 RepID=A0A2A2SJJ4_9SPHN|nr:response regulator transcription factor [Sphingomonas lenta]PAX09201.1 DNA-binding response regulator [Sphingomonas lenta]